MGREVKETVWGAGELVQVLAASNQDVPQAVHDLAMKHSRFRKGHAGGRGKGAGRGRKAQVRQSYGFCMLKPYKAEVESTPFALKALVWACCSAAGQTNKSKTLLIGQQVALPRPSALSASLSLPMLMVEGLHDADCAPAMGSSYLLHPAGSR